MGDSITFFVALCIIFLVLRWLLGQGGADQGRNATNRVPRRLHTVRPEHVQTIQAMFPDIPEAAIRADLARTGSPMITSDNILRNGGTLPIPPEARQESAANSTNTTSGNADSGSSIGISSGISLNATHSPLVSRVGLPKTGDKNDVALPPPKVWETDSKKRSEILNKRKEYMLMEARKRFLEKENNASKKGKGSDTQDSINTVPPSKSEPASL